MPPKHQHSCCCSCSWLCCVPHNFCLLSFLIACVLDVRMGKWLSVVSNHSAPTPSVSVTMWPCVCHLPCLIFLSLFFHSSVTMTAGWEGGGGSSLRWRWTGSWTENVEFGEQISCLANAEEVWGQQSVDADSPERRTLPCWDELRKNYYDSQLLKNVSHLNCARTMCLHHLNSQIETHICCSQCRQWCMNPSIWLLSVFLKKKK